jgi:hypothetical protein
VFYAIFVVKSAIRLNALLQVALPPLQRFNALLQTALPPLQRFNASTLQRSFERRKSTPRPSFHHRFQISDDRHK